MWLKGEERRFYLEVQFEHLHDGQRHRHDALVATVDAQAHPRNRRAAEAFDALFVDAATRHAGER